jgi:hypothetical protein
MVFVDIFKEETTKSIEPTEYNIEIIRRIRNDDKCSVGPFQNLTNNIVGIEKTPSAIKMNS